MGLSTVAPLKLGLYARLVDRQDHPFATAIRIFDEQAILEAATLIEAGLPVAVPTETVYGLAARADRGEAVATIYEAKGRPSFNPLIVHVLDPDQAKTLAIFNDVASRLADRFWPGPLTLVLPLKPDAPISSLATAGLDTIALRCPAHPVMRALLAKTGLPLAAPSANISGSISPTDARHVWVSLEGKIPLILDGGPTEHGLESTIVEAKADHCTMMRPGPLSEWEVAEIAGVPVKTRTGHDITAPGQLTSHYAPSKPLRLEAHERREDEWMIGFADVDGDTNLSSTGNMIEAAANLFAFLHLADASSRAAIAIAPVPEQGLGVAINDRLRRAAAPRNF